MAGTVDIDRLHLHLHLAATPDRVEAVARRLQDASRKGLDRPFRMAWPEAGQAGPEILFIDRMELECSVNMAWDDEAIGAQLARQLASTLREAAVQPSAIAFRDRAEFVAAFALALADGSAWRRWWFEEFDGLRALSASAALRTMITGEGESGLAALARLTEECRTRVIRTLTAGDAARLLEWLAGRRDSGAPPDGLWRLSASLGAGEAADPRAWLSALVACERRSAGSAGTGMVATLRAMIRLRELASEGSIEPGEIVPSEPLACLRAISLRWAIRPDWIERIPEEEAVGVAEDLARLASDPPRGAGNRVRADTPHGGLFVLLGVLARLPWIDRWRQALPRHAEPDTRDTVTRALALAVAAKALSPNGATAIACDPASVLATDVPNATVVLRSHARAACAALRDTLPPGTAPRRRGQRADDLAGGTLEALIDASASLLLHALAERILGLARSSPDYLRANVLALPATLERADARVVVALGRAPLDVLVALSGAKRATVTLPGGPILELREEGRE